MADRSLRAPSSAAAGAHARPAARAGRRDPRDRGRAAPTRAMGGPVDLPRDRLHGDHAMSRPRIAVAGFQHETNTFSPLPTTFEDFARAGAWPALVRGADLREAVAGLNLPMGGFLDAAEGFEVVPVLWAAAEPGGYVDEAAFDRIADEIVEGLCAARPDGVYLDLHGAMVTRAHEDAEAELLGRIRAALGPDRPVAISLDLHANVSPELAARASAAAVYRTYPHIDLAATGARAAGLLARLLAHGPLAVAHRQAPFLVPITEQSTLREPGAALYAALPRIEAATGAVSVDLAMGFPPADIAHRGPSVLACAETRGAADAAADALLAELMRAEDRFTDPLIPAAEAVRRAIALSAGATRPVVIGDPQDNPGAGAPGDATGLLCALLDAGATDAALALFWDPAAAAAAHAAGEGATLDLALGGSHPATGGPARPVRAVVERLSDGRFAFSGPMYRGATADLGPMACLRVGGLRVVTASRRAQNADLETFRAVGVEPAAQRILAVKSAVHFLAAYEPIAEAVLFAEAPGANPCRLDAIPFTRHRPGLRARSA